MMYEVSSTGRELVGFADVTDRDRLGDAIAARGHDQGDVLHLPVRDE